MTDTEQPPNPDHAWIHERLAAAVAGGLSAQEQGLFDAHVNGCAECFDAFTEARDADRALQRALAPLAPSAQFEENLLETLREKTMHKRIPPVVKRAGMAIAAAVALAATGVFAQYVVSRDSVTRPLSEQVLADAHAHGITLPMEFPERERYGADNSKTAEAARNMTERGQIFATYAVDNESVSPKTAPNPRGLVESKIVSGGESGNAYPAELGKALSKANDSSTAELHSLSPEDERLIKENAELSRANNELQTSKTFADQSIRKLQDQIGADYSFHNDAGIKDGRISGIQNRIIALDKPMAGGGQGGSGGGPNAKEFLEKRDPLAAKLDAREKGGENGAEPFDVNGLKTTNGYVTSTRNVSGVGTNDETSGQRQNFVSNFDDSVKASADANSSYYKPNADKSGAVKVYDVRDLVVKADEQPPAPPTFNLSPVTKSGTTVDGPSGGIFSDASDSNGNATGKLDLRRQKFVNDLMSQAEKSKESGDLHAEADNLRQALVIDPNNDAAKLGLQMANEAINYRQFQKLSDERSKPGAKDGKADGDDMIPYTELLVYPEDWVKLTKNQVADANHPDTTHTGQAVSGTQPGTPANATVAPEVAQPKIIRNGVVEFEVRSFDDASGIISAITREEGGFVSSTSSDKLANGKIRGQVVVRVPPEHLDMLLHKLRALGELKTQQIGATDVSKEYTDIESELRALRAMESRLIDLIKNGKGEVKDLVVAEKQLGEYRVRIEKLEGDIRYYNNLVGMATLTINAYEKDIQTPTAASEMENVSLSVETDDVEAKYQEARKVLADNKGRIVESELKKADADQYSANIVVDVPADKTDLVTAQLKQIGKVASYNRDRKQTTTGGSGVPTVQVEQKDTRFTITLYNLANIAPRETTVMTIAVRDVQASYQKTMELVRRPIAIQQKEGEPVNTNFVPQRATGRIVTSSITGQQPQQMAADIHADLRDEEANAVLQAIRDSGEVLTSSLTENADTANSTTAKRGLQLHIVNVAAVPAREKHELRAVAENVHSAYTKLLAALQDPAGLGASAVIAASQLQESDPHDAVAVLAFSVRRDALPAVDKAFADAGIEFVTQSVVRSDDTANTLDSKVYFQIDELRAAEALAPRRTTTLSVEVDSVESALETLRSSLAGAPVKEIEFNRTKNPSTGRVTGHIVVDTPVASAMPIFAHIRHLGGVEKGNEVTENRQAFDVPFARERIDLTLTSHEAIVESGKGVGATVRAALASAAIALLWSLYLILTGVLFIGPFALVIWIIVRLARRRRPATTT